MIFGWIIFCKIIGEIFLTASTVYNIVALPESVTNLKKMHVYGPEAEFSDVIIGKAINCGVVH